ncbi:nucleotidyltransferase [Fodinisporobacter ferrooxydans]|uniref:tRNA(Met) cytidine acetate ligase n=1 Tax=Fodinisporobacter ferrooxydans TaxID=2901836 RepID=A0ABY4CG06_9BACL|nr:nucleotidyltransferase [Alicyclobacillaceae bacterium MYW30-H2]
MRIAGIVVEYNPMHNGHAYHLQQTKAITGAAGIVAVMSGNFLQRGEPALVDKWSRTQMALQNGVDLVLELPFVFANQNATQFAYGAIATLDALGIVDSLCFGSEAGDIDPLQHISRELLQPSAHFHAAFEHYNALGHSFPKAMAEALGSLQLGDVTDDLVKKPNNALGIAYLQAIQKLKSAIKPYTTTRIHADYHHPYADHESIASATAIRNMILQHRSDHSFSAAQPFIPATTLHILQDCILSGKQLQTWEAFSLPLFAKLETLSAQELAMHVHIDEGLAARIKQAVRQCTTVTELIRYTKTRRYTWTRIQRSLTSVLLGLTKQSLREISAEQGPSYIRILGFNETGRKMLKQARKISRLPILTNLDSTADPMLAFDLQAARIYARSFWNDKSFLLREFQPPVMDVRGAVSDIQSHPPTSAPEQSSFSCQ